MSGAHEGCSQGKSVRDREGSKHSTAATPERVDSEAAVLPQDFEDTVHARLRVYFIEIWARGGSTTTAGEERSNRKRGARARGAEGRRGAKQRELNPFRTMPY
jgi:hypothetical protein